MTFNFSVKDANGTFSWLDEFFSYDPSATWAEEEIKQWILDNLPDLESVLFELRQTADEQTYPCFGYTTSDVYNNANEWYEAKKEELLAEVEEDLAEAVDYVLPIVTQSRIAPQDMRDLAANLRHVVSCKKDCVVDNIQSAIQDLEMFLRVTFVPPQTKSALFLYASLPFRNAVQQAWRKVDWTYGMMYKMVFQDDTDSLEDVFMSWFEPFFDDGKTLNNSMARLYALNYGVYDYKQDPQTVVNTLRDTAAEFERVLGVVRLGCHTAIANLKLLLAVL